MAEEDSNTFKVGSELELTVESLAYGGKGVGHVDGYTIFLRNGLPGETVMARITKRRSRSSLNRPLLCQRSATTFPLAAVVPSRISIMKSRFSKSANK